MKLTLSPPLHQAATEAPVEVHDSATKDRFYLISAEQYEKLRLLLEVEKSDRSLYEAGEIHLYAGE